MDVSSLLEGSGCRAVVLKMRCVRHDMGLGVYAMAGGGHLTNGGNLFATDFQAVDSVAVGMADQVGVL